MQYLSIIIATAALLSGTACADKYGPMPHGNVDLTIGTKDSGPLYYGDLAPWDVLKTLYDHCTDDMCDETWDLDTNFLDGYNSANDPTGLTAGKLTVRVLDSSFNHKDGIKAMAEGLITLSKAKNIVKAEQHYYCGDDTGLPVKKRSEMHSALAARGVSCDVEGNTPTMQYSGTQTWYMRTNFDDGSLRSQIRVSITAGLADDAFDQLMCSSLMGAGSAIAGAFTGGTAIGVGLSLGSLVCGAI